MIAFWSCALIIYLWLLRNSTGNVKSKLVGMPLAFIHLFFARDGSWKKLSDPQETLMLALKSGASAKRKRIYFIRHGESMWNQVFNRGLDLGIVWRFVSCVIQELQLLPFPDSVFWDSPLSPLGIRQAVQLSAWLEHADKANQHAAVLRGDAASQSLICTSNLRRSVSTILTSLSGRLLRSAKDQVFVLSSAQEVTRNIDGFSLSAMRGSPSPSWIELEQPELDKVVTALYSVDRLDGTYNKGNKSLTSNGLKRMSEFANWLFTSEAAIDFNTVILGGHSLWFKEFFKAFLHYGCKHEAKSKKIVNCGVIAFDLIALHGRFVIDPESLQVVYGGFESKQSLGGSKN